jgi:hypothetical protein
VTAVRTILALALVFTIAVLIQGYQPVVADTAPVLVTCADGPTCATTPTTWNDRTVTTVCEFRTEPGCVPWKPSRATGS